MVLECLVSTQMATQSKVQGSKEIVKKEEVIDCYSTMADAGDHSKPLEKTKRSIDSMFRRSVKVEISPAKVENTEFRQPAKTAKKESSILSPPSRVVKKEERDDNISTMVLLDKSSPSSPVPLSKSGKNKKKEKIRSHEALKFKDGAPDTLPLPPVSSPVHVVRDSTSLAEDANKTVAHVSISPSSTKRSRYGSPVRNESRTATTYVDHGVNTHSIWESEAEDSHGDGSSNVEDNGNEATISNKHVVETNTDDASSVLNGGQLACLDCGAVFETNDAFKVHIASHGGYRRYKCNVCGLRFINSGNLNVHMRKHTGEKPFKCDVCEKTFTLNGHLQRHRLIHTGERPFKCIVCNKGFSQSAHFRRHTLIHTGERPYKCAVCDKSFSEPGNFRRHKLIHTGEKPYNCLTCGKWFNQNSNLKLHRRTHEDFNGVTRQDVSQDCVDRPSSMDNDAVNGQKIFYKTKSIDYVVEKKASRNPNVVYLVWSKQFTIELASAVAHSGYNCILCVKKIQPESFRDVVKLSNSLHTSLVEVGPDSKTLRLFSFGGIILPEKITNHGRFKSMAKLEAKLKRFMRSQEMEMVNIFKHSAKNNGWYKSLRLGLKGDCIITDKI